MGAPIKFNRIKQERAKVLLHKGYTTTQCAGALKLSYATIRNWQKAGMRLRAA